MLVSHEAVAEVTTASSNPLPQAGWWLKAFPEEVCLGHVSLQITHAISQVVLALRSTEELKQLLPHILPSLLRWASEMLSKERLLCPVSSWRRMFLEGQVLEEKPCR